MKTFILFVIAFCAVTAVADFYVGNYTWGFIQTGLAVLNTFSYLRS